MGLFNNLFNKNTSGDREAFPKNLYEQIIQDNGKKNVVLAIEMDKPFPSPPFVGPIERAQRNNKIFFTKMFNGRLTITKEFLKIDNSKEIHTPKFDIGHEIELDYILTIYMTKESWTLEYYDKETKQSKVLAFEQFLYYGGK
jgi:hypothetical protein